MRFIRIKQLQQLVPLSRVSIWRLERQGKFPARRILGRNSVAWILEEVESWIKAQPRVISEFSDVKRDKNWRISK